MLAPENEKPSRIVDHAYVSPEGEPWGRCVHCSLAEAAHVYVDTPYHPTGRRTTRPEV